ncbi:hypothetical protein [Schaalia cardiffensis]|uniref:hypothetical protein n=1 Tax=Schaalia cardiffensis TaxID=181487 RepID=UPI0023F28D72|nr:hypothetical protein [Schaalia cardiffensis]
MTIDALIDPSVHVLARASARPEVQAAMNSAIDALTRLRFHEGLRRGWEEARAEATIHEATALSLILGARTSVNDLRLASLAGVGERLIEGGSPLVGVGSPYADTGSSPSEAGTAIRRDPAMDLAIGIQRSQTGLVAGFPPLNSKVPPRPRQIPLPALVASIHRDICSGLVESGRMSTRGVAMPKSPEFLAPLAGYLSANAPALARAAAILAHFRFREVFTPASPAVGAALARRLLVLEGVDPTGVCTISVLDAHDPVQASRELAGWVSADEEGVARWILHFTKSVEHGAKAGENIALHVQAGRLG